MINGDRLDRLNALHDLRVRVDREIARLEAEFRATRRRRNSGQRIKRRQWIEHGTNAGYQWHLRHGLPFPEGNDGHSCGCREAHAAYVAVATRRRKTARRLEATA